MACACACVHIRLEKGRSELEHGLQRLKGLDQREEESNSREAHLRQMVRV